MTPKKLTAVLCAATLLLALLLAGCNVPEEDTAATTTSTTTVATSGADTTASTADGTTTDGTTTDGTTTDGTTADGTTTDGTTTDGTTADGTTAGGDTTTADGTTTSGGTTTGSTTSTSGTPSNTTPSGSTTATTKPTSGATTSATTTRPTTSTTTTKKPTTTTTTKKTTTTTTQTTTAAVESLFGIKNNSNGTKTDIETGVTFIDDPMESITLSDKNCHLYSVGKLLIDGNHAVYFDNDTARVVRGDPADSAQKDWWMIYKLDSGITEAAVTAYLANVGGKRIDAFDVYVSQNGTDWTKAACDVHSADQTFGDWVKRTYIYKDLGKRNKYLKIQYRALVTDEPFYSCNIGSVRINNVDGMFHPVNNLENRKSTTYYVDGQNGSDSNSGTSSSKPYKTLQKLATHTFQPGDKILLKRGTTFTGGATLNGFGLSSHRLYIGAYGEGAAPKIVGNGGTALRITMDYVTVENLDVSNPSGTLGLDFGVAHSGANKGVIVQNCNIHDVNESIRTTNMFGYDSGAIRFKATDRTAPCWFEGVTVRKNTMKNTTRCAVYMDTSWADRYEIGWGCSREFYKDDNNGWWPLKNISIAENEIISPQGDAILVIGGANVVIEKNVVYDAFAITASDMSYMKQNIGSNSAAAAIWTINCNDVDIQYNDVGYTNLPSGGADGESFDIDGGQKRVNMQYNYSHNNEGGFMLLCDTEGNLPISRGTTNTIRFNLSVDDGCKSGQGVFMATTTEANNLIYNNTIIIRNSGTNLMNAWGSISNYTFQNNIFYGKGNLSMGSATVKNVVFKNNIYTGGASTTSKSGVSYSGNKTNTVTFKNVSFQNANFESKRAQAIAAFTPQNKISGATALSNFGGKDVNGTTVSSINFYGCIKH